VVPADRSHAVGSDHPRTRREADRADRRDSRAEIRVEDRAEDRAGGRAAWSRIVPPIRPGHIRGSPWIVLTVPPRLA